MFEQLLLEAVVAEIKTYLGDSRLLLCDLTLGGAPPSGAGQVFYGVDSNGYTNSVGASLECLLSFRVVITMDAGFAPSDRLGTDLKFGLETVSGGHPVPNTGGLSARARRLIDLLHGRYPANVKTNAALTAAGDFGRVIEPPVFKSVVYEVVDCQWLGAEPDDDNPPCGMKATLTFGDVKYERALDDETLIIDPS